SKAHGVVLVTGPTGSGKTTTLYASLNKIYTPSQKIITIEDPVEYQLDGIIQMPVNPRRGLTFSMGLRHIVRQDPDIIMVGEVRDLEAARISIQSALTGHLVFSTMHTNDSAGAVTRLLDLGIESYLASSSLIAVVAQRLIRMVCPECGVEYEPEEAVIRNLGLDPREHAGRTFRRGTGCDGCIGRGYVGRTGIFEILVVDDEIRRLIKEQATAGEIKNVAAGRPTFTTLRMDGARKVLDGVTTAEEVLKVTQMDLF
ncbi:MAG: Flp pilus assembly complex ATPase component TadA, partial [Candidatus Hydrogenedentes bacterium]|nr:Flp pilus assembly complex ATPase component TadA [Candidatus Hydrogenedentota bacterium]